MKNYLKILILSFFAIGVVFLFTSLPVKAGYTVCPSGATYNSNLGECVCSSDKIVLNNKCVSKQYYCDVKVGEHAFYSDKDGYCLCTDGYVWDKDRQSCVWADAFCYRHYGYNSKFNRQENKCECLLGYKLDDSYTCIEQSAKEQKMALNQSYFQRPTNLVVMPSAKNYYLGKWGRKIYTDRPAPKEMIGAMVKGETDPATYIVDAQGNLRWIKTEQVAQRLFGPNWDKYITWFSDAIIYTYPIGEDIYN